MRYSLPFYSLPFKFYSHPQPRPVARIFRGGGCYQPQIQKYPPPPGLDSHVTSSTSPLKHNVRLNYIGLANRFSRGLGLAGYGVRSFSEGGRDAEIKRTLFKSTPLGLSLCDVINGPSHVLFFSFFWPRPDPQPPTGGGGGVTGLRVATITALATGMDSRRCFKLPFSHFRGSYA